MVAIARLNIRDSWGVHHAEIEIMVSQKVIPSKQNLGESKPFVFTETGVAMLPTF